MWLMKYGEQSGPGCRNFPHTRQLWIPAFAGMTELNIQEAWVSHPLGMALSLMLNHGLNISQTNSAQNQWTDETFGARNP